MDEYKLALVVAIILSFITGMYVGMITYTPQQVSPVEDYLRKNYSVSSIEELIAKYRQEALTRIADITSSTSLSNLDFEVPTIRNEEGHYMEAGSNGYASMDMPIASVAIIIALLVSIVNGMKGRRRKEVVMLVLLLLAGFMMGVLTMRVVLAQSSTQRTRISKYTQGDWDVLVFRDGDYAVAVDRQWHVIAKSTDHASVIQAGINHLTNGSKIVILSGDYYITKPIRLRSYIIVEGEFAEYYGGTKLIATVSGLSCIINLDYTRDVIIKNIWVEGNNLAKVGISAVQLSPAEYLVNLFRVTVARCTEVGINATRNEELNMYLCRIHGNKVGVLLKDVGGSQLWFACAVFDNTEANLKIGNLLGGRSTLRIIYGGFGGATTPVHIQLIGAVEHISLDHVWIEGGGTLLKTYYDPDATDYFIHKFEINDAIISIKYPNNLIYCNYPYPEFVVLRGVVLQRLGDTNIDVFGGTARPKIVVVEESDFRNVNTPIQANTKLIARNFRVNYAWYRTENSGYVSAINGTWVAHSLAGTPSNIILTVEAFNVTAYVITKNSTHFMIGLAYLYGGGAGKPVTTPVTVYWQAKYEP